MVKPRMIVWKNGCVSWCGKVRGDFPAREGSKELSRSLEWPVSFISIHSPTLPVYDSGWQTTAQAQI